MPDELLPVEAFPSPALPEAFRPWVADVQRMNCHLLDCGVLLIVAAASLVARLVGNPAAGANRLIGAGQPVGADRGSARNHEVKSPRWRRPWHRWNVWREPAEDYRRAL
ncbi:MAG: hypothetical protein U1E72_03600 [Burkholderiaceae bacterium]